MNKKITPKDLEVWKNFTKSKIKIEDKDRHLDKKLYYKGKRIIVDLHGYSLNQANKKIRETINDCYIKRVEKILVITGKGLRSKNKQNPYIGEDLGILKHSVPDFINTNIDIKNKIQNISEAKKNEGGEGAFCIFLKKFKE